MSGLGAPTSTAPGLARNIIRSITARLVAGNVALVELDVWEPYRNRFLALFVGGVYTGKNFFAPPDCSVQAALPLGTGLSSIYVEDAGAWPQFEPDQIPFYDAAQFEASAARRLQINWTPAYTLSTVRGDSQLSNIIITGARRGQNVAPVTGQPTRGRLSYSITGGTANVVRWWADGKLVAEGSRTENGALTCAPVNDSGLTVSATLAYAHDLPPGTAFIDIRWPAAFQVHYSQAPLTYPRTPQKVVLDSGLDDGYAFLTPELTPGAWHYNVLQVDDEGDVQTSITPPADSPVALQLPPRPPTISGATGNASALTVAWSPGEGGCFFTVYASRSNRPVNFGDDTTPAPITTAPDAVHATLAPITDFAPVDREPFYNTLRAAFDSAVTSANTAYAAGESGFAAAIDGVQADLLTAIRQYADNVGFEAYEFLEAISKRFDAFLALVQPLEVGAVSGYRVHHADGYDFGDTEIAIDYGSGLISTDDHVAFAGVDGLFTPMVSLNGPGTLIIQPELPSALADDAALTVSRFTSDEWAALVGIDFADLLGFLGALLEDNPGRYSPPAGVSAPSAAPVAFSLREAAQPFIVLAQIRIVVRGTKSGVQECGDSEYVVEFDANGNIVPPRPNLANIEAIAITGGVVLQVTGGVLEDNAIVPAACVDLYVVPIGSQIDPANPQASVPLPTPIAGYHAVAVSYTVPATGDYQFAVAARSSAGGRSALSDLCTLSITDDVPGPVSAINATAAGCMPARSF